MKVNIYFVILGQLYNCRGGLFNAITSEFDKKNVFSNNLVAPTYDGAANMSGKYNGLQALIKKHFGEYVIYMPTH